MLLRDYQQYAVDSLYRYFEENKEGNPVIAMPTGTGKSLVIGGLVKGIFQKWPTQRVMMLTHVKELIEQNADKLKQIWENAPIGFFSAGLKAKETRYPITFAGIQSASRAHHAFAPVDLIIIDECHLVSPKANTSYQMFLAHMKELNPNLRVIGLSATAYRLGLGMITDGGIFTDICCDMTTVEGFNWFIDEGYLSPLIPFPTETEIDLSNVATRGGEYVEKDIQRAVDKAGITDSAIRETLRTATGRQRILVFAAGVDHVEHIRDALHLLGETAVCVHSRMSSGERERALAAHRNGEARWMVNANVLTTGYDDPHIDCIVMLRPTQSPGLWVQMLGRGTRPVYAQGFDLSTRDGRLSAIAYGPKQNCLVLDFAGNTMRLGPVNDPVIPKRPGKGGGEPPVKLCETNKLLFRSQGAVGCGAFNHASARFCCNPDCKQEFEFRPNIVEQSSKAELIRREKKPKEGEPPVVELFDVNRVVYAVHEKAGGSSSLKVTYHCGMRQFKEWVPAWHETPVRFKGKKWWEERADVPLPDTPEDAVELCEELAVPRQIRVWLNPKYPEIVGHVF